MTGTSQGGAFACKSISNKACDIPYVMLFEHSSLPVAVHNTSNNVTYTACSDKNILLCDKGGSLGSSVTACGSPGAVAPVARVRAHHLGRQEGRRALAPLQVLFRAAQHLRQDFPDVSLLSGTRDQCITCISHSCRILVNHTRRIRASTLSASSNLGSGSSAQRECYIREHQQACSWYGTNLSAAGQGGRALEQPKSESVTAPRALMSTFSGLRSPWTTLL